MIEPALAIIEPGRAMTIWFRIRVFLIGLGLHGFAGTVGLILGVGRELGPLSPRSVAEAAGCGFIFGPCLGLLFIGLAAATNQNQSGVRWMLLGGSSLVVMVVGLVGGKMLAAGASC